MFDEPNLVSSAGLVPVLARLAFMVDLDNLPTLGTPRLFEAIGRVAFAWADVESELGRLLVALMHTPLAGVLTVGQNFPTSMGR